MTHGSLFSGIGGFDLAAEWAGWDNKFHCEWNEFGKRVLNYYWPKAECYDDITKTDFTIWRGRIDVLTGGFPCQPYSAAGKRLGTADDRHLWPEMLRAIREISPRWVVGENVRGLTNWNGGLVFDEVQADLEAIGYEITPFLLPACGINAPHRRDRIWFIAFKNSNENGRRSDERKEESSIWKFWNIGAGNNERICANDVKVTTPDPRLQRQKVSELETAGVEQCNKRTTPNPNISSAGTSRTSNSIKGNRSGNNDEPKQRRSKTKLNYRPFAVLRPIANTPSFRTGGLRYQSGAKRTCNCNELSGVERGISNENATNTNGIGQWGESNRIGKSRQFDKTSETRNWQNFPTQPPICGGDDELPSELDGITFPKWRAESIKAFGNAVVPELVYQIFKSINAYEEL